MAPAEAEDKAEAEPSAESGDYALYLDTSALLKLYVSEDGTDTVEEAVAGAWEVHTQEIAYLEARVSLVRLRHSGVIESEEKLRETVGYLDADWPDYVTHPYSYALAERGAGLASAHEGLRSYDALHLATALEIADDLTGERETLMLAYDKRLVDASRKEIALYHDPYKAAGPEGTSES